MELHIQSKIFQIRNQYIMLDKDLAELYQVPTKRINEAVKRNINRFPKDFMFQLTQQEWQNLKSHNATTSWGGRRTSPYCFAEVSKVLDALLEHKHQQDDFQKRRSWLW